MDRHSTIWPQRPADLSRFSVPGRPETVKDALFDLIADLTIGIKSGFARSFDHGGVKGIPEFDITGHRAGHLHRTVLGLGRHGDNQVKEPVFELIECLGFIG